MFAANLRDTSECRVRAIVKAPTPSNRKQPTQSNPLWQALAINRPAVQTKLVVGHADDEYEQEADLISDRVMASSLAPTGKDRKSNGDDRLKATTVSVAGQLSLTGSVLNAETLTFMQSRLGQNFSGVRVHTGPDAARAAESVNARAFTLGQHIAFASGSFSPATREGRRLIAHELVHVGQQARTGTQVLQRAPALSGRKTTELVDDSIAGDVDKALAESKTITRFIAAKSLKKTSGHLSVEDPAVFASLYADYAKKHKDMPDVKNVPGFTDREKGKIVLKLRSADIEAAIHEAIHLNSSAMFANHFGHACNEGLTEYFTEKVLAEQGLGRGRAYRDELKLAKGVISVLKEDPIGRAYFKGETKAYAGLLAKLNSSKEGFSAWHKRMNSDKTTDWEEAVKQMKALP